jgi:hypothetical protein
MDGIIICKRKRTVSKKTKNIEKSLLKEVININDVVNALGLPTQKKGSKISFLCPHHNDKHFGSCYIMKNNYYCYACNTGGDAIKLVQTVMNYGFEEALEFIADIYGGKEHFEVEKTSEIKEKTAIKKAIFNSENCNLVNLKNEPIYNIVAIYYDEEKMPERKPNLVYEHISLDYGDSTGYTIVKEKVIPNPLMQLYTQDRELYNYIVNNAIIKQKNAFIKAFHNAKDNNIKTERDMAMKSLIRDCGLREVKMKIQNLLETLDELKVE